VEAVPLRTHPHVGCRDGAISGVLVTDSGTGAGISVGDTAVAIVWPLGFSAVRIDGVMHLLDGTGTPVAREGDQIRLAGGYGVEPGVWFGCDVTKTPS
jgi:hypothetical protein